MRLKLERPIVFIDVQSTGLDPKTARIVRLSTLKVEPGGERSHRRELIDPGCPIPPGATAVHGITDDDVAGRPTFRAFAGALAGYLSGCDMAGFGLERFALPLLRTEFARAHRDVSFDGAAVIDAMTLFHRREPRDFASAFRRFVGGELPADMDAAEASYLVLDGQLAEFADLPSDVEGLDGYLHPSNEDAVDPDSRLVWSPDGEVLLNFGRHRGQRLSIIAEEAPDYLQWVAGNDEFNDRVRGVVGAALRGDVPSRPAGGDAEGA